MLKTNGHRDGFGSLKYYGVGINASSGEYASVSQGNNHMTGRNRNFFADDNASISNLSSFPSGARHPQAWVMPQKAGGLSSRNNTKVSIISSGAGQIGKPLSGTSTITIDAFGLGGLIVSGSGSSTISITPSGSIAGVILGGGETVINITVPDAAISSVASLSGLSSVVMTATGSVLGIASISGISTNETEFSATALANAVWTAAAATYNDTGTMGEKLNDAGSAGNPWAALLAANNDPETFGKLVQDMQSLVDELHKIQGLSSGNPMTVTTTTRTVGDIDLAITGDGTTTTTVTRI